MRTKSPLISFLFLLACSSAYATVNLPLTCTGSLTSEGKCVSANRIFALPVASTLVVVGDVYTPFDGVTGKILVCQADIPPGTGTAGCLATDKVSVDKCLVAGANCTVNKTGVITLTWQPPNWTLADSLPESALTGYKLYSCAILSGNSCVPTLWGPLPISPLMRAIPGYGNGRYSFSLSAVYGATESVQ